jgi:hypothetical protein
MRNPVDPVHPCQKIFAGSAVEEGGSVPLNLCALRTHAVLCQNRDGPPRKFGMRNGGELRHPVDPVNPVQKFPLRSLRLCGLIPPERDGQVEVDKVCQEPNDGVLWDERRGGKRRTKGGYEPNAEGGNGL